MKTKKDQEELIKYYDSLNNAISKITREYDLPYPEVDDECNYDNYNYHWFCVKNSAECKAVEEYFNCDIDDNDMRLEIPEFKIYPEWICIKQHVNGCYAFYNGTLDEYKHEVDVL